VTVNHLCLVFCRDADPTAINAAARCVEQERLPEIAIIQDLQQRQASLFLEPDRLAGRVLSRLLLEMVRTGFLPRFFHKEDDPIRARRDPGPTRSLMEGQAGTPSVGPVTEPPQPAR
jgi:hypothetical protein